MTTPPNTSSATHPITAQDLQSLRFLLRNMRRIMESLFLAMRRLGVLELEYLDLVVSFDEIRRGRVLPRDGKSVSMDDVYARFSYDAPLQLLQPPPPPSSSRSSSPRTSRAGSSRTSPPRASSSRQQGEDKKIKSEERERDDATTESLPTTYE